MTATTNSSSVLVVDVQIALSEAELKDSEEPPSLESLSSWASNAYSAIADTPTEVTLRLVGKDEIVALNRDYRQQNKTTNVLSFPFQIDKDIDISLLGDVVICHSVILDESKQQSKTSEAHYAHMVTHGILHLCGYDHQNETDAEQMELLEISILADQGFANPYH